MLRNLVDTLRIRYAVWSYHRNRDRTYTRLTDAEQAGLDTLHGLNADTQARLRHAALLEAHDVPEELVHLLCKTNAEGRVTRETLNQLYEHGMRLEFHLAPTMREQIRDMAKVERLQHAVKRLAFIAGPGFTTQQLIDDGLIKEGDL